MLLLHKGGGWWRSLPEKNNKLLRIKPLCVCLLKALGMISFFLCLFLGFSFFNISRICDIFVCSTETIKQFAIGGGSTPPFCMQQLCTILSAKLGCQFLNKLGQSLLDSCAVRRVRDTWSTHAGQVTAPPAASHLSLGIPSCTLSAGNPLFHYGNTHQ